MSVLNEKELLFVARLMGHHFAGGSDISATVYDKLADYFERRDIPVDPLNGLSVVPPESNFYGDRAMLKHSDE